MRKILAAVTLLLALSCPTLAGEMHTPGTPEPPPTGIVYTPGETELPLEPTTNDAAPASDDGLTRLLLDLWAFLPSLPLL